MNSNGPPILSDIVRELIDDALKRMTMAGEVITSFDYFMILEPVAGGQPGQMMLRPSGAIIVTAPHVLLGLPDLYAMRSDTGLLSPRVGQDVVDAHVRICLETLRKARTEALAAANGRKP